MITAISVATCVLGAFVLGWKLGDHMAWRRAEKAMRDLTESEREAAEAVRCGLEESP